MCAGDPTFIADACYRQARKEAEQHQRFDAELAIQKAMYEARTQQNAAPQETGDIIDGEFTEIEEPLQIEDRTEK